MRTTINAERPRTIAEMLDDLAKAYDQEAWTRTRLLIESLAIAAEKLGTPSHARRFRAAPESFDPLSEACDYHGAVSRAGRRGGGTP